MALLFFTSAKPLEIHGPFLNSMQKVATKCKFKCIMNNSTGELNYQRDRTFNKKIYESTSPKLLKIAAFNATINTFT